MERVRRWRVLDAYEVVNPRGGRGIYHLSTDHDGATSICLSKAIMVPAVITVPQFEERGFSDPLICDRCLAAVIYRPRENEVVHKIAKPKEVSR